MDERGIRERLRESARSLSVETPPVAQIVRRARRRSVGTALTIGVAITALGGAFAFAVMSLFPLARSPSEVSGSGGVTRIPVGGRPIRNLAVGQGAAWAIVQKDGGGPLALVRVDAETNEPRDVDLPGEPEGVMLGSDAVWVTISCGSAGEGRCDRTTVVRLDPKTLVVEAEIPLAGRNGGSLAYGERSVWVGVLEREWRLVRIDPTTNRVVATIEGCCHDLEVGEGAVWGIDSLDRGDVLRIDPATNEVVARIRTEAHILAVGEGGVWVVAGPGFGAPLVRIDPATNDIAATIPKVGFGYFAAGQGAVWIARCEVGERCIEILRVDPQTNELLPVTVVNPGPNRFVLPGPFGPVLNVGVGEGAVWVGSENSGEILRIPLPN
jgi:hypothetical protein